MENNKEEKHLFLLDFMILKTWKHATFSGLNGTDTVAIRGTKVFLRHYRNPFFSSDVPCISQNSDLHGALKEKCARTI